MRVSKRYQRSRAVGQRAPLGPTAVQRAIGLLLLACLIGCGGGNSAVSGSSNSAVNIQGKWQVVATSSVTSGAGTVGEVNLTQNGSTISGSNVAFISFNPGEIVFTGTNACGGTSTTLMANLAGNSLAFTLTENGPMGTRVTSGTETVAGDKESFSGGYSSTGCGTSDSGALNGSLIEPLTGAFSGVINGVSVSVTLQEDQAHNLTVTGTSGNGPFTLTGTAEGGAFVVSGPINGTQFEFAGFQVTKPLLNALNVASVCFTTGPCVSLNGFVVYEVNTGSVIGELNQN